MNRGVVGNDRLVHCDLRIPNGQPAVCKNCFHRAALCSLTPVSRITEEMKEAVVPARRQETWQVADRQIAAAINQVAAEDAGMDEELQKGEGK